MKTYGEDRKGTHDVEDVLVVGLLVESQDLSERELSFDVCAGSIV